jgi:hypothetical protein
MKENRPLTSRLPGTRSWDEMLLHVRFAILPHRSAHGDGQGELRIRFDQTRGLVVICPVPQWIVRPKHRTPDSWTPRPTDLGPVRWKSHGEEVIQSAQKSQFFVSRGPGICYKLPPVVDRARGTGLLLLTERFVVCLAGRKAEH